MSTTKRINQKKVDQIGYQRGRWAIYLFLAIVVVCQLLPFYLAINASMKPQTDMSSTLMPRLHDIAWDNWTAAITDGRILHSVVNSVIVTVCTTLIVCVVGAAAAYPLARRATRFNKVISALILYTMLVNLGGANTYWGIVLVLAAINMPLSVFLYTAFIRSIPVSVDEAGMIDGANRFTIFVRLILPMLKPVTATVIIMTGTTVWNDYALSVYLLTDADKQTIAPRVASFFAANSSNLGTAAAAALIAAAPMVIAYLFLQKYFIAGMIAGAEK